jgi:phosphoglycolate phosphatase
MDMDGTICDSARGILNSLKYALESFGIYVPDIDKFKAFLGPPIRDSFRKHFNFEGEELEKIVAKYRERFVPVGMYENDLYPGIADLLKDLKDSGKTVVLATAKVQSMAQSILEHFGIPQYFDFVSGSEMDGTRSYKNEIILHALEHFSALDKKDRAVMVGDRNHDINGAAKAGIKSVGVLYGYGSREELEECKADYIVRDVAEFREFLLKH